MQFVSLSIIPMNDPSEKYFLVNSNESGQNWNCTKHVETQIYFKFCTFLVQFGRTFLQIVFKGGFSHPTMTLFFVFSFLSQVSRGLKYSLKASVLISALKWGNLRKCFQFDPILKQARKGFRTLSASEGLKEQRYLF